MGSPYELSVGAFWWILGFVSHVPWTLVNAFAPPEIKDYFLNMSQRLKAKRISSDPDSPYRCVEYQDKLMHTVYGNYKTVDKVFEDAVRKFENLPCLGTRELLAEEDEKQPDGKIFKKAIFGEYKWETFKEILMRVKDFGCGLAQTGQKPKEKIALFMDTRTEWMISIQACFRHNFPVVTVYATLGEEGICHALNETEVTHVITSATLLNTRLKNCLSDIPNVKHVIYVEDVPLAKDLNLPDEITLYSFSKVENMGQSETVGAERDVPEDDDLAIVMYTSGQSGDPKGVLISHANFVAAMSGMGSRVPNLGASDTYIGYLPLAHVLELAAENVCLSLGARIGYSSPLTLSDRSSRIKQGSKGDASVLQPTVMAAVPEIMARMRKAVMQNVDEMSPLKQKAFRAAYRYKLRQIERGYDTPILNRVIFKKPRMILGGRVRLMLSGGASLDTETQRFMNVCMCAPIGQGYGLTETCGATSIAQTLEDFSTGRVGPPLPCSEVKLVAWEEGGYSPTNKPHPQGEIHIGGPNITMGYFKKPEKTAEDFYVDESGQRWFKTGDIGQVDPDGAMRVIDRKKDLVKLSHGEYLALGSIEAKLKSSPLIDNVWVYAVSSQPYAICVVIPNQKAISCLANGNAATKDFKQLCADPMIEKELKSTIFQTAKLAKLQKFEIPQKFHVEPEPWLPEDGLITAAFKLKRKALEKHYQEEINKLYGL